MKKFSNDFAAYAVGAKNEEMAEERKRKHAARLTGAHTTMPIEDDEMVKKFFAIAKEHDKNRRRGGVSWYLILLLGFNTGLRIGDLCKLKVSDVRGRERIRIIAEKTGKETDIKLQAIARDRIDRALAGRDADEYALQSRQKGLKTGETGPITRQRCYAIVKEIAGRAGYTEHVGCHSMRKTFAWNFYKADGGNLAMLQKVLNHSSQEATIHYLGLDRQAIDAVVDTMRSFG